MAILVLKAFAVERRAAGRTTQQETTGAHVRRGPEQVPDPLIAEHRVINVKRNHADPVAHVGRAGGDERSDAAGFVDAFFQDLSVLGFTVGHQAFLIDRLVKLADGRVDADLMEQRIHAEGAGFVGDDRHDQLADVRHLEQRRKHAHEDKGRGRFATASAFQELAERIQRRHLERLRVRFCTARHVAAQRFAPRPQVFHFLAVFRRAVKRRIGDPVVGDWNPEARAKLAQFVLVEFLLLVRDVLAFADFTQAIAFDRLGQDDRGRAFVLDGRLIRRVDFLRIVPAAAHLAQLPVGEMLDHLQQLRMHAEKVIADVAARLDAVFLIVAVHGLAHAPDEQAFVVLGQ